MGFTPVTNPQLVIVVTVNRTAGDSGMGAAAAAPVFKAIATEALRMLDVPKDIPEGTPDSPTPLRNDVPPAADVSIADLGGDSVMEDDTSLKQLLAEQAKPAVDPDEIPPARDNAPPTLLALAPAQPKPAGPVVPDFRGKSMGDVVEEASADGIEVMIEGSGVARAQLPLPGTPLRQGERIRIVFAR
jgi:cell division protein FtsI (penicillin-binding protein 3)